MNREEEITEWTPLVIHIPDDDYDEDDELDALIEKNAHRKRGRVVRGVGLTGI